MAATTVYYIHVVGFYGDLLVCLFVDIDVIFLAQLVVIFIHPLRLLFPSPPLFITTIAFFSTLRFCYLDVYITRCVLSRLLLNQSFLPNRLLLTPYFFEVDIFMCQVCTPAVAT